KTLPKTHSFWVGGSDKHNALLDFASLYILQYIYEIEEENYTERLKERLKELFACREWYCVVHDSYQWKRENPACGLINFPEARELSLLEIVEDLIVKLGDESIERWDVKVYLKTQLVLLYSRKKSF